MLPQEFTRRIKEVLHGEYEAFEAALDSLPPVSLRINPYKYPVDAPQNPAGVNCLAAGNYMKVPWCGTGYYLPKRPSFTADPLFHAGCYYVQEASSMFLEQALLKIIAAVPRKEFVALDLCAAPGGKSTHLLSLLPEGSLLVCNDVIRSRCMILAENMTKWGQPNHIVTNSDPGVFGKRKHLFDIILADLPCSGEGLFRKDTASRNEWSAGNVKLCALRQKRIILDVWDALKPGGWLIYSTCTFNTGENEDNVYDLAQELGAGIVAVPANPEWNVTGSLRHDIPVSRFFPHRTRGEGFFLALMRKHKDANGADRIKTTYRQSPAHIPAEIKGLLSQPDKFTFFTAGGPVYALPERHKYIYSLLAETSDIVSAGIHLGEFKGKDFTPSSSLALSTELRPEALFTVGLSYENALNYLRKEAIILSGNTPKGYVLVTYGKRTLGFVKNIGNRANNLYPREWRIRKKIV